MKVSLKWITPDAEKMVVHMARVSNVHANIDDHSKALIYYLLEHKHWSPFEMACMCVEIHTTRDIGRQILRHRSFHFQEFSQRYAEILPDPEFREARLQDKTNRQKSIITDDEYVQKAWLSDQAAVWGFAHNAYLETLKLGIAKEQARVLLPEGLTPTILYMQGTIRDWIHYVDIRCSDGTQLEHQLVAGAVLQILYKEVPIIMEAAVAARIVDKAYRPDQQETISDYAD